MIYPGTWPIYRSNLTIYLRFSQTKRTVGSRTGGMSWFIIALPVCLQSENRAITFLLPAAFFNPIAVRRGHLFKPRILLALLSQHIEQTQLRFLPFSVLRVRSKLKQNRTSLGHCLKTFTAQSLPAGSRANAFAGDSSKPLPPQCILHLQPTLYY